MGDKAEIAGTLKDIASFTREGIIVIILLLFLLFPGFMNGVIKKAGFTSVNLAGFLWELQDSIQNVEVAKNQVNELEESLSTFDEQLREFTRSANIEASAREKINRMATGVNEARRQASAAKDTLQENLGIQRSIIEEVDPNRIERKRIEKPIR